jgi:hypothetical protein
MAHIGRNDPCPCGSGKKYKKCCIDKETSSIPKKPNNYYDQSFEDKWEDEEENNSLFGLDDFNDENDEFEDQDESEINEDFEDVEEDDLDIDFNDDEDDFPNENKTNKDPRYYKQLRDDDSPEISDEEEKLIDQWYAKYSKMKDPQVIHKHIEGFMDQYPQLVENMELHHEVVFELGAAYIRISKYDDFVQFLFRFRKEFPASYLKSFGYYDYNIIVWLISQNRIGEIPEYLENFKKYPVDFVDKLFELLDLLYATNHAAFAYQLVSEIYPFVFYSEEVFGGESIVTPLIIEEYLKVLHPDYTEEEINQLVENLKTIKCELLDRYYSADFWKENTDIVLRPFTIWDVTPQRRKEAFHKVHYKLVTNFHRFLKEKTGISWISANFYVEKLAEYLARWVERSDKPHKVLFDFSPDVMDKTIGSLIGKMMWIDFTSYAGHFNAIYYFADYLYLCGNIDEIERDNIQTDCTRFYNKPLESLNRQYTEAKAFKQFPLWGRIQY